MSMAAAVAPVVAPKLQAWQLLHALDASGMQHILSAALDEAVSHVSIERTLFSKSRPVVIHYRYQRAGDNTQRPLIGELVGADARLYQEAEMRRLAKARRSQIARSAGSPLFHAEGLGLVLRRPGFDANLLGLRLLHDKAFAADMVARAVGQALAGSQLNVSLKAHRLGKRAVLLVECKTASGTSRRIYVRLRPTTYDAGRAAFENHVRIARHMQGAAIARIPKAIHFDTDWGAAFFEEMPGTAPRFFGVRAGSTGKLAGCALAEWRALGPAADGRWSFDDEVSGLNKWATLLSKYEPHRLPAFDIALEQVSRRLASLPMVEPAPCHRDFHEAQLLVDRDVCGILDFDTCCNSDLALDVGNFAAHIRLWERRNSVDASEFAGAFVATSSEGQPSHFAERIAAWKGAALLRLAAIYAFTSEADHIVNQLVDEAAA